MRTIEPGELSGYLDGELDRARAAEVGAALAEDAALAAELAALSGADAKWSYAARTAQFLPDVRLARNKNLLESAAGPARLAGLVAALLALRFLPGLGGTPVWAFAIHGVALAAVVAWVVGSGAGIRGGSTGALLGPQRDAGIDS